MAERQSSLVAPSDAVSEFVSVTGPNLTDDEAAIAYKEQIKKSFPMIEKKYADPPLMGQKYSLHSFIPSKGATPDSDGVYGMLKVRGCFESVSEATDRSETLVREYDSYHKVFVGYVGRPMPLTEKSTWSDEVEEIDLQKKVSRVIAEDVKAKRADEQLKVKEIRERERTLKESVEQEASDPYEKYTCLRVKKAQVIWGYLEHRKKMAEMEVVFDSTMAEIMEMDEEDDDYAQRYLDRYKDARERAGIPEDKNDVSFMKYLDADVDNLSTYAQKVQDVQEDDDYKVSRQSGSTISVRRVEHDIPEGEKDASIKELSDAAIVNQITDGNHPLQNTK